MNLKSIGSPLTEQGSAKTKLQGPNENSAKKGKNTGTLSKGADKVSLSARGLEQSAMALKLVEQLLKTTQSDPGTAVLALGKIDLEKATALLQ